MHNHVVALQREICILNKVYISGDIWPLSFTLVYLQTLSIPSGHQTVYCPHLFYITFEDMGPYIQCECARC